MKNEPLLCFVSWWVFRGRDIILRRRGKDARPPRPSASAEMEKRKEAFILLEVRRGAWVFVALLGVG